MDDRMKANRISDDSGVEVNMTDQSCGSESIMSSISSSISSLFNYKYSVNSNPESRLSHPSPQPPEVVCEKKLSHVQLMRMRFENMCKFTSNEEQRPKCEPGCNSNNIIAEQQPAPVVIEGKPVTIDDESEGDKTTTSSQNACDCDNVNTSDLQNGAIEFEALHNDDTSEEVNSDFEESFATNDLYEVKNAEICYETTHITEEVEPFEDAIFNGDCDVSDGEEVVELTSDSDSIRSRPPSFNKTLANLMNIVDELLDCELKYIVAMQSGIRDYKSIFRDREYLKKLPDSLRGQESVIFGNIERICDFHQDELLPSLAACDRDISKICEVFCDYIKKDRFYMYVLYVINRTKSELVCIRNANFFRLRQEEIGDRLGLNSFLVKPIQRLPHYQLLFNQMIVELLKNMDDLSLKPLIAVCCRTEKNIQKLLDTVNESMHINDIENCLEFNILLQGKFRKNNQFDIFDRSTQTKYRGRLFLFERSLVYTEQLNKNRLVYRGHYLRTKIGIEPEKSTAKPRLILFSERVNNQCIEITGDVSTIIEWKMMIDDIIKEFIVEERKRVKKGKKKPRAVSMITPELRSTTRGSIYSNKSFSSDSSATSSDRSSKISQISNGSEDLAINRRTTWAERKSAEKLISSEKNFLKLMDVNKKFYIDQLPVETRSRLETYIRYYQLIFDLHQAIYEKLNGCFTADSICELFKNFLTSGKFEIYNNYAITLGRVEMIVSEGTEKTKSNFYNDRITLRQFLLLPLKKLNDYQSAFNEILEDSFHKGETMTTNFKNCAIVEVELNHIYKKVSENYKLYALNDSRIHYKITGLVEHSEIVTLNPLNILNHRLIVTRTFLICVNVRANSYKEKFLSIINLIALKNLTLKVSRSNPTRLKLVNAETRMVHRVMFAKADKKETFQRKVIEQQKKIFKTNKKPSIFE